MSADATPWMPIAFVAALAAIVALSGVLGLYRRDGVRHQNRNIFGIALAAFFFAILFVMAELKADVDWSAAFVVQIAVVAAVVSVATIRSMRAIYAKHVLDGVFLRRTPSAKMFFLANLIVFVVLDLTGLSRALLPLLWPFVLGGSLAFLFLALFSYWHVAKLERALGRPLLEAPAPDLSKY